MSESLFTKTEREGEIWRKLRKHLQARVQQLRAQNDISTSDERTEKLRGRIAEAKDILRLGDEPAPPLEG